MCGICGLIDFTGQNGVDLNQAAQKMALRLAHRGPDAEGLWHEPGIAFGHRRLKVIDLVGSRQPMEDVFGRYVIVFNGEIYNYLEIRKELEEAGIRFRSKGDTEVLLNAYAVFGERCLEKLNGMYAFAIWDKREKVLFAARDRIGVKPFFYGIGSGGIFAFASEIQAFRNLPLDFSIRYSALEQYLRHGFIRSPATIFKGIQELRPAYFLRYSAKGLEINCYWEPPMSDQALIKRPEAELTEELRDLLRSSVHLRLRSDVPLGAFLSGGLDSSIIVAAMRDLTETEIHTYAIGFEESSFDESPHAKSVADYFGTIHSESRVALRAEDLILDLVRHYGQPYGDSSSIPTWRLCEKTREHVTVALSGDGGDELFCGYRRYVARRLLRYYKYFPRFVREKMIPAFSALLPEGTAYYDRSFIKKLRLFVALEQRINKDMMDIYPAYFTEEDLDSFLIDFVREEKQDERNRFDVSFDHQMDEIEFMMRVDLFHYLPDDILTKVDRASMAHALEVRSPFIDYRVVEFACRLPLQFKLKGMTTKYLLRKAFSGDLPSSPIKRKKHGFAVPLGNWFQGPLRDIYYDVVLSAPGSEFINLTEAERLIQEQQNGYVDHGNRLWLILFLHAWYHWWHQS
jgi:asparagine synthase (glutamine-hydrolysing)